MVDAATIDPTIVNTPPPAASPSPEGVLFPNTPPAAPSASAAPAATSPATPPATPPAATPPAAPTEPKPPTEPSTKPGQEPATPAPKDIDLKLPDGSLLSAEDLAQYAKKAKESGLTQEKAEEGLKALDQTAKTTAARIKQQQDDIFAQEKVKWKEAVNSDPELGGDKIQETVLKASRAFKAVASPLLQKLAEDTGLGSHPEFVRMMVKVHGLIGEDRFVQGSLTEPPKPRDPAAVLYGKTTPDGSGKTTP